MKPPWNIDPAETCRRLESLSGQPGVPRGYIRARVAILRAQAEAFRAMRALGQGPSLPEGPVRRPVLGPENVPIDLRLAEPLLEAIVASGGERAPGVAGLGLAAAGLIAAARCRSGQHRPRHGELLLRLALGPDPMHGAVWAEQIGAPVEVLSFLASLVAAPFVLAAASRVPATDDPPDRIAGTGRCPVCGCWPGLASLHSESGARTLHCSLCGCAWNFARLACPACGEQSGRGLTTISAEGDSARWIESCPGCKSYVKTVDLRRLPNVDEFTPLAEESATLYLDVLAHRAGLADNLVYAAMV